MTFRSKSQHVAAMLVLLSGPAVCFEVIGAGLSRSGTYSTKHALNALGFHTYHCLEVLGLPEQMDVWYRTAMGELTVDDAMRIVKNEFNYTATLDSPFCKYYKQQMEAFPEAKVLLTVRDSGKAWAESMWAMHELIKTVTNPFSITFPSLYYMYGGYKFRGVWDFTKAGGFLPDGYLKLDADKEQFFQDAIKIYDSHVAEVKAYVPENRLLVFNVKEGWDPLCRFLGVQTPDVPYPKAPLTTSKVFLTVAFFLKIHIYSWIPVWTSLTYLLRKRMQLLFFIFGALKVIFYFGIPVPHIGFWEITGTELLFVIVMRYVVWAQLAHAKKSSKQKE